MLPTAASDFYARQQRVSITARNEVRRLWLRMGDDFDASWRRIRPAVVNVVDEGKLVMAERADAYVPRLLEQADIPDRPEGDLVPASLTGMASDGRRLDTLADQAVTTAKVAVAAGASTGRALDVGQQLLEIVAQMQVADAARQAVGVLTASRKNIGGYVRVLNAPSCPRCAILAGKFFRWNTGFDRHPRCDCTHSPVPSREYAEAEGFIQSPMDAYRKGEIRGLTEAQVKAIEDGADLTGVVNAYKDVSSISPHTRVINRRGAIPQEAGVQPGQPDLLNFLNPQTRFRSTQVRLTPEGVYQAAGNDRDAAIRMLREYGYIR